MKNNKSWHGSNELKETVLSQMEEHYERVALDDLQVADIPLNIYGWKSDINFPFCAEILGLDEGLLRLGCYLFDGFPEDWKSIRELIRLRIEMLDYIPVNVDISQFCPEFIVWQLETADFGIISPEIKQQVQVLLLEVINVFYQDIPDTHIIQQRVQTAIEETNAAIATQWQKHKTVDQDLYRKANALKTVAAASQAFVHVTSADDTAQAYIHAITNGGNTRNSDEEREIMITKFIQLLRSAH